MRGCALTVGQWHAAAERAMCHRPAKEIKKKRGGGVRRLLGFWARLQALYL